MAVDIENVAKLANLPLTQSEKELFSPQLTNIITFVEKLSELDLNEVEPTSQVTGKTNALRDDLPHPQLTQEQSISNAKHVSNGYIVTKGVFDAE